MHETERNPLPANSGSPVTRVRTVVALLVLSTVAALLPACGGGSASSQPEGAGSNEPGAAVSGTPPAEGASDPTNHAQQSENLASGTGERFGMDPAEDPTQEATPRAGTEPMPDGPGPARPAAQDPSPPDGQEPPNPAAAPEPARSLPEDVAVDTVDPPPPAPAPAPEGQEEAPVAGAETPETSPSPAAPEVETPAEAPPPPAPEGAVPAPPDTTMYLTVPRLGIEGAEVVSDSSKEAMDQGVIHVPGRGFPWLPSGEEGSNTYLAAHRIGYPGTGSDRIFYELPALAVGDEVILTDSNGTTYAYRVAEASEVSPYDTWAANPVPGRDVVTLQTCIEDFGDRWGEGPDWAARYVVRADRVS